MTGFDMRNPVHLLATGFGAGLSPVAPGTFGTLVAVPLVWLLVNLSLFGYVFLTAVFFLLGIWLCERTASDLGEHDHGGIVWDEIVGYMITMLPIWLMVVPLAWQWLLLGFVLFRFFDIVKPWPIRWIDQHVGGGFGIMLDDLLAGIFAAIALQLIMHFLPLA
jgi:phosphatidylglycerophosphatase A